MAVERRRVGLGLLGAVEICLGFLFLYLSARRAQYAFWVIGKQDDATGYFGFLLVAIFGTIGLLSLLLGVLMMLCLKRQAGR